MRKTLVLILGVCLLALFVGSVSARDIGRDGVRRAKAEDPTLIDPMANVTTAAAAVDTFCLVWYDFEQLDWQGWTALDNTAQIDTFFHVDNFSGLAGGDFGALVPLEGAQSLWCGTRPDPGGDFYLCGWIAAPGYGSNWNQIATTDAFSVSGQLTWSFYCSWDSEQDWDFTYIEYDTGNDNWAEIAHYDGYGAAYDVHNLFLSQGATKLRYHFISDGNTDDQDGQWNSDGAFIVDSITVTDAGGIIDDEDFESYASGARAGELAYAGCFWNLTIEDAFGHYSGLSANLQDKDPCADNFGTQITFFNGSIYPSADYPGLFETPFCEGEGGISAPCLDAAILSPVIDMLTYSAACDENQDTPIPPADAVRLGGSILRFTVYRDLPLDNLVFYTWQVRSIVDDCPQAWRDRRTVWYGADRDYIFTANDISDLVGDDPIQFNVGVSDMCDAWYGQYGTCANHTPSPWIDNVRVYRYKTTGPSWNMEQWDRFQDMFPEDGTMEGLQRCDIGNDIAPGDDFETILMGDSTVVSCTAILAGGLDTIVSGPGTGEDAVWCHVKVDYIGGGTVKPPLTGSILEDDWGVWASTDVNGWDIFVMDKARTGENQNIAPDKYCIDLNDSLFTRGYMVEYYFRARDLNNEYSVFPASAEEPLGNRWEFTFLPTLRTVPGVLLCDDFNGRGGTFVGAEQTYFEAAIADIKDVGAPMPDRYDTNGPSSGLSNGIGAFVSAGDATDIFCVAYEKVIHTSGNLNSVTITEGTQSSDKSNDCQLLIDWLDNSNHKVGLLVMGDQVAVDLDASTAQVALDFMGGRCGVSVDEDSYYDLTGGREAGGVISPLITGVTGEIYDGLSYYIDGGCPIINDFAVLATTNNGVYCLQYPDYNSTQYYAGIYTDQLNNANWPMRTVFIGHSMYQMRNAVNGTAVRNEFMKMTYEFFENGVNPNYTGDEVPKVYSLAQNFPNPFNPSTRIQFALPTKGHVSLKIYNVAGQLVKTLQDGVMDAGSHEISWDGSNNLGANVASGVYFYKINAGDNYENMKKMVLLR
jgi:hypothetical protein